MIDEMLIAQEQWLPQYQEYIKEAKRSWEEKKKSGTLLPVKEGYRGTVRIKDKTVEEVAAEHAKRMITAQ